jgi:hypothetical protein
MVAAEIRWPWSDDGAAAPFRPPPRQRPPGARPQRPDRPCRHSVVPGDTGLAGAPFFPGRRAFLSPAR